MLGSRPVIAIFDLDNTLHDFAESYSPSLRAMIHVLAKNTNLPESQIFNDFKLLFQLRGTLEYRFPIQELKSFSSYPDQRMRELLHISHVAYFRTVRKYLKPYSGVVEILRWLHDQGAKICVATSAPFYNAFRRLSALRLLQYIDAVYCWQGAGFDETYARYVSRDDVTVRRLAAQGTNVFRFDEVNRKPSEEFYRHIVKTTEQGEAVYFSIGDNLEKDLRPCHALGMTTVWARYGTRLDPKNKATMIELTPSAEQVVQPFLHAGEGFRPHHTIDDIRELYPIIPLPFQFSLHLS